MLIDTAIFGQIEIDESAIYHMPLGLYGFDNGGDFAVIEKQDDDVTLRWFQSTGAVVPCFIVFDPFELIDGYEPEMERADLKALACEDVRDLQFLVISVVPDDISRITVNLKSPIVLNKKNRLGRQVILANPDYPISYPLVQSETTAE